MAILNLIGGSAKFQRGSGKLKIPGGDASAAPSDQRS
jgi:hypothetical protein